MDPRVAQEAEAFAELFEENGSLVLAAFLDACLAGFEGKKDFRDFTEEERDELMLNASRILELMEEGESE